MSDPLVNDEIVQGGDGAPWFVFARSPGRFRGSPAAWQGWVFLFGLIFGDIGLGLGAGYLWFATHQIAWFIAYFAVVFPLVFFVLFMVIKAKGREVPMGPPNARLYPPQQS